LACENEDELLALVERLDHPLAADLFCGAGGLSLGLQAAGFEVVLAVDHDEEALETHRAHHPGMSVNWDLSDDEVVENVARLVRMAGITLVAGGPPCQPFSKAGRSMIRDLVRTGRRHRYDERRDMWESFLRVVALSGPEAVLMENVPDMALDRDMMILRTMVDELENLGYSVEERVVDTYRYGVPQFRQRLILVALRDGVSFHWPEESPERVTVDNAIGDLPTVEGGWRPEGGADGWAAYGKPVTDFQKRARAGVDDADRHKVFDHITRPVREDDAIAFAGMDANTRYSDLAPELKRYRDDIFDDKYKRLDANDLSRTITAHIAKDGYWYIHPYQDRTLTVREAARLQTFPDRIRFAGPPSAAFRQIGNAVPPLLGQRIGEGILRCLAERRTGGASTRLISEELSSWFEEQAPTRMPWLAARDRWLVIQAELLWNRLADDLVPTAWAAVRNLTTPDDTLDALPVLRRLARQWNREPRCDQVHAAASWFMEHPEGLGSSGRASTLAAAPHVTQAVADLAVRVVPGDVEDPVLVTYGVLRVVARFHGVPVDEVNKLSDGRLAVARMVGGEDWSHIAHLALIELANGYCRPQGPECGKCPLEAWCEEARGSWVQSTLSFTSQEQKPAPEPAPAAGS
jgi:DNA (cytosine-5)-methyltransferase 1